MKNTNRPAYVAFENGATRHFQASQGTARNTSRFSSSQSWRNFGSIARPAQITAKTASSAGASGAAGRARTGARRAARRR
ncbi:MAG: hypothetical protein MZV64_67795 [Ignavibacteriales bacterium]|nr:hypothetical protein [Ignavibacteriales bacterium]